MKESRRKRCRQRIDKQGVFQDSALPWPIPEATLLPRSQKYQHPPQFSLPHRSTSFFDLYTRVPPIGHHFPRHSDLAFKFSNLSAPSTSGLFYSHPTAPTLSTMSSATSFIPDNRAILESVSHKLDRLIKEQAELSSSAHLCKGYSGTTPKGNGNTNIHFDIRPSFSATTNTTMSNSDEVCTLYPQPLSPSPPALPQSIPTTPIGVFWDIENCQVPSGKSALVAVQRIRERFFKRFIEAEFICVCDIRKESPQVIQELNDAQVSVIHVSGNSKNAADDKLRQSMRRYADTYTSVVGPGHGGVTPGPPPAVLLISGDVNFATDLSDLRHRKRVYVVLLHNKHAPESLILCAHEHFDFHAVLENLPDRQGNPRREFFEPNRSLPLKGGHSPMDVVVTDLPQTRNLSKLKNRLKKLSDNCGGKVVTIQGQFAVLRFPNKEAAMRASKRMNGEDVFGSKIRVIYSSQMDFSMQGQLKGNVSQSHIPVQPLVSVAPMMLPGSSACTSVWKPTWTSQVPTASLADLSLTEKASEPVLYSSGSLLSQNGNGNGGYGSSSLSNSKGSSRDQSPANLTASNSNALAMASTSVQRLNSHSAQFFSWNGAEQANLKREVAGLLQDVPNHSLPLFKFREMFEKRYRRNVSSADLYKLKDVVTITESNTGSGILPTPASTFSSLGRTITLDPDWTTKMQDGLGIYCNIHPPSHDRLGWAEREIGASLPHVVVDFRVLSHSVHALLESHSGGFPLMSFLDCYEANFEPMERVSEGTTGVHLEHLIASVQGVEISMGENNMKRVQWSEKRDFEPIFAPGMTALMAQLSRELVDLLKTFPKCSLPFSKIIPAYHHHYGRQCRVADYGHASLSSLLLTLPNTIQVMGEGQNRIITLAHKAQMKRFATDVLRVLKGQPGLKKQIRLEDFPTAFSQLFPTRAFAPEDYGLCFFSDLVSELVENSSLVTLATDEDGGTVLSIPKREQTPQEIHRTRMFAVEVIELLAHAIRLEMPFSKFIPAYHHHFGRQCRVADYGFGKLAELFEAISETAVLDPPTPYSDCGPEDKIIHLAPREQAKVVGDQIWNLVDRRNKSGHSTRINDLEELYMGEHGFALRPHLCGAKSVEDLIENHLSSYAQLEGDRIVLLGRPLQSVQTEHPTALAQLQPAPEARGRYRSNSRRYSHSAPNKGIKPIAPPTPTFSQENVSRSPASAPSPMYPGYEGWMIENGATSSPPVSPPVIWTYHPVCYPNPYSPGTPTNVLMPSFSYSQWSPPPGQPMSQVRLF